MQYPTLINISQTQTHTHTHTNRHTDTDTDTDAHRHRHRHRHTHTHTHTIIQCYSIKQYLYKLCKDGRISTMCYHQMAQRSKWIPYRGKLWHGKCWWIWQITKNLPKFFLPSKCNKIMKWKSGRHKFNVLANPLDNKLMFKTRHYTS